MEIREELFDICWHERVEGIMVSNLLDGLEVDVVFSSERTICDPSESTFVKMNTSYYKGFSDVKYCLYYKTADDKFVMILVNDTEEFRNIKFNVVKNEYKFLEYTVSNRYYAFDITINQVACKLYDTIMKIQGGL